MNEWINASDRLPEELKEVLVVTQSKNGSRNIDKGYRLDGRWIHRGCANITHWMQLPEPPKEG